MKKEYTIGEMAALMGISRDALRLYEKKGLVSPKKKENGYRYYSEADMWVLLDLLFWRKQEYSLQQIESLEASETPSHVADVLDERIRQELCQIEFHKKLLGKVRTFREAILRLEQSYETILIHPLPRMYVFSELRHDLGQTREDWFEHASVDGMEFCCVVELFSPPKPDAREGTYDTFIGLEESAVYNLGLLKQAQTQRYLKSPRCIHTIQEGNQQEPVSENVITHLKEWAVEHGLEITGEILVAHRISYRGGAALRKTCMEYYLPLKGEYAGESHNLL